jgi:hypothetical protein
MQHLTARCARIAPLVGALLGFAAYADDTLRCGNALITVGMVRAQVQDRCGEPKDKSVSDIPIRARRPAGTSAVVGAVHVERWTYDRGYGQFPALLTFENGKLKSIELLTSG